MKRAVLVRAMAFCDSVIASVVTRAVRSTSKRWSVSVVFVYAGPEGHRPVAGSSVTPVGAGRGARQVGVRVERQRCGRRRDARCRDGSVVDQHAREDRGAGGHHHGVAVGDQLADRRLVGEVVVLLGRSRWSRTWRPGTRAPAPRSCRRATAPVWRMGSTLGSTFSFG